MIQLLKTYKKRLTNLTSGNRSLLLLQAYKRQFFDLHALDFAENKPAFSIIEQLIAGTKRFSLCSHLDPRNGQINDVAQQLKLLSKTNEMLMAERGAEDLYVGFPMVRGKLIDGSLLRCPLLFFPVELSLESNTWKMNKANGPTLLNRSLLLAYAHFNEIKISDELLETNLDELNTDDARTFLTSLYELLKQSPLEINFNADLFFQKLEKFETLSKTDFDEIRNGEIKLFPEAVLGIFPQTGSYIAADYDELINEDYTENYESLEDFLSQYEELRAEVKEEHLRLPLPVDASQEEAIRCIKMGKSLVIQGPPGTGKSQLICNLMADYAAEGKRVLLVCQKRAAIDTVYNRLSEVGMGAFAALVHDFKADRHSLYDKLNRQIENILAYKHENQSLNAIFLEREFDAVCRKIDKITNELGHFKRTLFDNKDYGKSAKELYLLAGQKKERELDLSQQYSFFHFDTLDDFLDDLSQLEKYRNQLETGSEAAIFWKLRKSFSNFSISELQKIKVSLGELAEAKTRLSDFGIHFSLDMRREQALISRYCEFVNGVEVFSYFQEASTNPALLDRLEAFSQEIDHFKFSQGAYELKKPEEYLSLVEDASEKNKNIFGSISWKLLSKDKKKIFSLLQNFGFEENEDNIEPLNVALHQLIRLKAVAAEIGFSEKVLHVEAVQNLLSKKIEAARLWKAFEKPLPFARKQLETANKAGFDESITALKDIVEFVESNKENWEAVLSTDQIKQVSDENLHELKLFVDAEFDNIHARDALYASLSEIQKYCYSHTENVYEVDYVANFKQNLILHFIEDLEQKNPVLRHVSSLQMELLEQELQELVLKKQKFSKDHLLLKLRERTYKNIEKNRLGNPTTYRELQHQVSKKKQVWPVRKLIEEFYHELFDLLPCWMASPETVSAIFPLRREPIFDLVIFDEASQCFTENGLPAMLRGKQIAVAGDDKQLRPNDLYKVRFEEDSDNDVLLEVESLLDLAKQFLPSCTLKGHYRSKSLDLIDFSNTVFYQNKLTLLPDFKELNEGEPAIEFIQADGVWENNRNQKEAQRIVELVRLLRTAGNKKSIGIVTFNFQQAELISEMLGAVSNVTIKNIENIQGDEFDLVIFSVGYAADTNGALKMNFGSLGQKGGENRLNVAITRAREKVIVVCSLQPETLHTDNATNDGPRILQAYLIYAKNVSERIFIPTPARVESPNWGKLLKDEFLQQTEQYTKELPFADLVEKTQFLYGKLLFTDDDLFYSASSIKESYAYTPLILKEKGWTYQRIWSRNWWQRVKLPLAVSEEKAMIE